MKKYYYKFYYNFTINKYFYEKVENTKEDEMFIKESKNLEKKIDDKLVNFLNNHFHYYNNHRYHTNPVGVDIDVLNKNIYYHNKFISLSDFPHIGFKNFEGIFDSYYAGLTITDNWYKKEMTDTNFTNICYKLQGIYHQILEGPFLKKTNLTLRNDIIYIKDISLHVVLVYNGKEYNGMRPKDIKEGTDENEKKIACIVKKYTQTGGLECCAYVFLYVLLFVSYNIDEIKKLPEIKLENEGNYVKLKLLGILYLFDIINEKEVINNLSDKSYVIDKKSVLKQIELKEKTTSYLESFIKKIRSAEKYLADFKITDDNDYIFNLIHKNIFTSREIISKEGETKPEALLRYLRQIDPKLD